MFILEPIEYDDNVLIQYIYNTDGITPTSGLNILDENIEIIRSRIREYLDNTDELENVLRHQYSDDLETKLKKMYDSTSLVIKVLKNNIRSINKTVCSYCGTQDSPYQIDHYLPRSVFPEYSVLSNNLVPSCATCNSRYKGDGYIFEDGSRLFFNPYYDTFINSIQFLKCDLSSLGIYIDIEFFIDDSIAETHPVEYKLIYSHFEELHLNERYIDLISDDVFPEFYDEFVELDTDTEEDIFMDISLEELKLVIDKRINRFRRNNCNYWKKVFFETLRESNECLNLIVDKHIPLK